MGLGWVRGMGMEFSILKHLSYVWLRPSHFAALCLSFLKLENVCKTEVFIKLLAQLLACGWHSTGARDGGHRYYYEMGKSDSEKADCPRPLQSQPPSESWNPAHQGPVLIHPDYDLPPTGSQRIPRWHRVEIKTRSYNPFTEKRVALL